MTTIQKLFVLSFFAFIALFSQNSNAQSLGTNNFERKHIATASQMPTSANIAIGDADLNGGFDITSLPDGLNVIAQTREHILLAVIMEKGKVKGIGSIDQTGSFHQFEPDTPCSDFEIALCQDGSKPDTYYNAMRDECVSFCDDIIDLDHTDYKPINPYGLRPNGPCSDFIAQPCRKGTSMVVYYDAHTEKCVMMCDY